MSTPITSEDKVDPEWFNTGYMDLIDSFQDPDDGDPLYMNATSMFHFIKKPNLTNARKVLKDYGIIQPLQSLVRKKAKTKSQKRKATQKGGAISIPETDAKEVLAIDTLHDLKDISAMDTVSIYQTISKLAPNIQSNLRNMFLSKDPRFTLEAANYLYSKHNIHIQTARNIEESRLANQIIEAGGENYKHSKFLDIVLDNIVANVHTGISTHEANITFIGCAFILILCYNMRRLEVISSCEKIRIYDGYFQYLDGRYVRAFVELFAQNVRKSARVSKVEIHPTIRTLYATRPYIPVMFNEFLGVDAKIQEYVTVDNIRHPYIEFNGKNYAIANKNFVLPKELEEMCVKDIRYPHNKREFTAIVLSKRVASRDLWYLNFLRDCIKAELAIEKGAIFLTHDRLAHLYYRLIGGKCGFLIGFEAGGADDDEELVYRVSL